MAKRLLKLTSPMMKGDDVKEFQTLVNAKGYSPGKIDGIYGNNSVSACKAFQKASGLSVDGMCGDKTWAALEGRRTLKKTSPLMSGADVKEFQTKVREKGFDAGAIDGKYGDKCVAACQAFQGAMGLSVDGICGKNTWAALDSDGKPSLEKPQSAHFKLEEWRCNDGQDVPVQYYGNLQRLMDKLEELRAYIGNKPITIASGYRSPEYNEMLRKKDPNGVAKNSQHLYATAADIKVAGMKPSEVQKAADKIFADGGMGKYSSFTHVDVRGHRARW